MKKIGNFIFEETSIKDVFIITPKIFNDERGYFLETYKEIDFRKAGIKYNFVQDNQSFSTKGVLRGLHFQRNYPQTKLVRVLEGEVFDVCVDLRRDSKTYGKWVGVILSDKNMKQFLIPRGFAHGFLVLSDTATFAYKCDDVYHSNDEGGIMWNDPDIAVKWPYTKKIVLSEKDTKYEPFLKQNIKFED